MRLQISLLVSSMTIFVTLIALVPKNLHKLLGRHQIFLENVVAYGVGGGYHEGFGGATGGADDLQGEERMGRNINCLLLFMVLFCTIGASIGSRFRGFFWHFELYIVL